MPVVNYSDPMSELLKALVDFCPCVTCLDGPCQDGCECGLFNKFDSIKYQIRKLEEEHNELKLTREYIKLNHLEYDLLHYVMNNNN